MSTRNHWINFSTCCLVKSRGSIGIFIMTGIFWRKLSVHCTCAVKVNKLFTHYNFSCLQLQKLKGGINVFAFLFLVFVYVLMCCVFFLFEKSSFKIKLWLMWVRIRNWKWAMTVMERIAATVMETFRRMEFIQTVENLVKWFVLKCASFVLMCWITTSINPILPVLPLFQTIASKYFWRDNLFWISLDIETKIIIMFVLKF